MLIKRLITLEAEEGNRSFEFVLSAPTQTSADPLYYCEYEVFGLLGTRGARRVHGRDPIEAFDKGLYGLTAIANCLPSIYCVSERAFSSACGPGIGFRKLPDLQAGMAMCLATDFQGALPLLLPYASQGIGELQLAVGSLLFLWRPSDPAIGRVAFSWCECAARQGIGQAYQYMADICRRFPNELPNELGSVSLYLSSAKELGFYLPGEQS